MMLEKKGGGAKSPQKKGHKDEKWSKLQEPENPGGSKITKLTVITVS